MVLRSSLGKRSTPNNNRLSPQPPPSSSSPPPPLPPSKRRQQSTVTNKAIANFFTPTSQKEPEKITWRVVKESVLVGHYGAFATAASIASRRARKVAIFDLDSTLIRSASGRTFGRDAADWKWWHSSVPTALKELHGAGYLLAVISNQGGLSLKPSPKTMQSDQKRLADFKSKLLAVFHQLSLPISVYAATARDEYRKPRMGMWRELLDDHDLDGADAVSLEDSFFVGDAGGRQGGPGGPVKDHSGVDRDFAANVGLVFHTPEEYFLHEAPRPFTRTFDPLSYINNQPKPLTSMAFEKPTSPRIILFCGSPGAGKSSFYWKHLQPLGYGRVNQDILKTREKCTTAAAALLAEGTSVAVDNTNADLDTRAVWVKLAQKLNVPIQCALFTTPAKACEHNDAVRAFNTSIEMNPEGRTILPKLAFTSFGSRYREPKVSEGFTEIVRIDFEFDGSEEQKKIWSQYWM